MITTSQTKKVNTDYLSHTRNQKPEKEKKISNSFLLKDITEHWLESGGLRNGEEAGYWTLINGKKFGESADGK